MKNKLAYLSFLNVVSCIAVIMLHTNGCFWYFSTKRYWLTANIIESVMYFAVPIFFMISGATVIDYRERYSTKVFLKKRIKKTFIPFIIWSLIGLIYMVFKNPVNYSNLELTNIISQIFNAQIIKIYWFFIPLFSIYLSIPIISLIQRSERRKWYLYLAVVSFVTVYLLPFLCTLFKVKYNPSITVAVGSGYILYVLVGYLVSHYEVPKKIRITIYIFSVLGLLSHLLGTYYLSISSNKIITIYKGYINVPCFLYSLGIFVLLKNFQVPIKLTKIFNRIISLDKYTFGIYLIHFFIMDLGTAIFKINIYNIYYRIFAPFIIFIICIAIINIIKKIPYIRIILP